MEQHTIIRVDNRLMLIADKIAARDAMLASIYADLIPILDFVRESLRVPTLTIEEVYELAGNIFITFANPGPWGPTEEYVLTIPCPLIDGENATEIQSYVRENLTEITVPA